MEDLGETNAATDIVGRSPNNGNADGGQNGHGEVVATPMSLLATHEVSEVAIGESNEMELREREEIIGRGGIRPRKGSGPSCFSRPISSRRRGELARDLEGWWRRVRGAGMAR